jgi:hypothetical protein
LRSRPRPSAWVCEAVVRCYEARLACADCDGATHVYFLTGKKRIYHKRPWRLQPPDDIEIFESVYPGIRVAGLRPVGYGFPELTPG